MDCIIRLAAAMDAEQVLSIYAPFVTETAITFEIDVPTVEDIERRIIDALEERPWLVFEKDGEILGYAYAAKHRSRAAYQWSVESSVYIHPQCRRRGIGRALYVSLFRILELQKFCNVYGGITLPNPASVRLHETCGFKKVGVYSSVGFKLKAWHDVGWWHLCLRDIPISPRPPLHIVEARNNPAFDTALSAGLQFARP